MIQSHEIACQDRLHVAVGIAAQAILLAVQLSIPRKQLTGSHVKQACISLYMT